MGINYKKLGFKSGLEIHQQLDTGKLFCGCPSLLRKDGPDFTVQRKLHAVAGESGKVDIAAEYQAALKKTYEYQAYKDTTCLVELDEEPPHNINLEPLKIALQVAVLLNCQIQPLTQIMRKTVIDGSNTSGFQRTVLIAHSGFIETSEGRVGIESICLEEDSARRVSNDNEKGLAVFRLDRLGIPLVEIATAPDLKNPEMVKEAALELGGILRSLKVKRGIGTIRQDVNVSIREHPRVEIKGFQDPKMMVKTIELEIKRQQENIKNKNLKNEVRKALPNGKTEFLRPMPGAARMYPETDLPLLKIHRNLINEVKKSLPKLKKDISEELKAEGLHTEAIKVLLKENLVEEFKELLKIVNNPKLIVKILVEIPKNMARRKNKSFREIQDILGKDILGRILDEVKKGKLKESHVKSVLEDIMDGKSVKQAIKIEEIDSMEVEENILKIIKKKPGLSEKAYMGLVMKEFKGKISGNDAMTIIKKYVK